MTARPHGTPNHWKWVRLGDHVTKIGSGCTPTGGQAAYLPQGIPLIRSQNVHMNRFSDEGLAFISPEQDAAMDGSRVYAGDVLLNITGASIGRVCVAPERMCPANVNQHVSIIRANGEILPEFLAYFVSTPDFQRFIMEAQAGGTRQALTKTDIEAFQVPLPSVVEQRRIVAILTAQMAAVDKARVAAEARLKVARALPAAYLRAVFNSSQTQTWPRERLDTIATLLPSKSIATAGDTEVRAITTACLSEAGFQPVGVKSARMWGNDAAQSIVRPGEVLVARSNTPELVGRVSMFEGEPEGVVASDLTIRLWVSESLLPRFLTAYLSFLYLTGYWQDNAGGASGSMKKITRTQIAGLALPVPPKDVQQRIAKELDARATQTRSLSTALDAEVAAMDSLRISLMCRAFVVNS